MMGPMCVQCRDAGALCVTKHANAPKGTFQAHLNVKWLLTLSYWNKNSNVVTVFHDIVQCKIS